MFNRPIMLAATVALAVAGGTLAAQAGPQAGLSGQLAQSVGSIAVQTQAQPAPDAAATTAEPRRRFWGPILGSMERAANRNAAQNATGPQVCAVQDVREYDPVTRAWVTRSKEVCN